MLTTLLIIHILAALIGLGPNFFGHYLLRKNQTVPSSARMSS